MTSAAGGRWSLVARSEGTVDMLALRTLGRMEVCCSEGCVSVASWNDRQAGRRALCLVLGRLAVDAGRWLSREQLIDVAWTENEYGRAEAGFYAVLRRLRSALREMWPGRRNWIECDDGLYRLVRDSRLMIDCQRVPLLVSRARRLADPGEARPLWTEIVELCRGDFLAEVNSDEPWVIAHRARMEELRLTGLLGLARTHLAVGDQLDARELLWSALAEHGDDERVRETLLASYSEAGRTGSIQRAKRAIDRIDRRLASG